MPARGIGAFRDQPDHADRGLITLFGVLLNSSEAVQGEKIAAQRKNVQSKNG